MGLTHTYAELEQADVADLTTNSVFFRCYVWRECLSTPDLPHGEARIVAAIFTEGDQGETSLLNTWVIAEAQQEGSFPICPKVIANGTYFVVFWVDNLPGAEAPGTSDLYRSSIDLASYQSSPTWSAPVSQGLYAEGLYDVSTVEGSTDYVLVRQFDASNLAIARYDGPLVADTVWTQLIGIHAQHVLGIWANDTDADVLIVHGGAGVPAGSDGELWTIRRNATDGAAGTSGGGAKIMTNLNVLDDADFTQVGICRIGSNLAAVVAEFQFWDDVGTKKDRARGLCYCAVNTNTEAQSGNDHYVPNLHLLSRPWSYPASELGATPAMHVYAVAGYKSLPDASGGRSWTQSLAFVVDFDRASWGETAGTVRPFMAVNLNTSDAIPETRPGGYACDADSSFTVSPSGTGNIECALMNHVSHVSGPHANSTDLKTRTVAMVMFERTILVPVDVPTWYGGDTTIVRPSTACIRGRRISMEDPWTIYRDTAIGQTPPTEQWSGCNPLTPYQHVPAGRGLFIGGGAPSVYDGRAVVECNYPWAPEIYDVALSAGASLTQDSTYGYLPVCEWRDNKGQIHRVVGPAVSVATPAGADQKAVIYIRTQTLSLKDNAVHYPAPGTSITINLYRTLADGLVYYRMWGSVLEGEGTYRPENTPVNDPFAANVSLSDNGLTDAELILHEMLDFSIDVNGNITPLPPVCPPAFIAIANWKNAVWGATQTGEIWYSNQIVQITGRGYTVPEFPGHPNVFRIDGIGEVTAMQDMDDYLVIFTRDRIYALQGDGNDGNGVGSTLTLQTVARGTGCIEPRSVVLSPMGIFFQSAKGYYRLGRDMQLDYSPATGASVEDEIRTAGNIRAAVLMENEHLILASVNGAITDDPRTLAYDYLRNMWFVWKHQPLDTNAWSSSMASACAWRCHEHETAHVILQQGGVAFRRAENDAAPYADENDAGADVLIPIDVELDWVHLASIARVWKVGVQMTKPNTSAVHFTLRYDWTGTYDDTTPDAEQDLQKGEPAAATGWIRCIAKADFTSPGGDYVVVPDADGTVVNFWFDVSGSYVPVGGYDATNIEVDISTDTTPVQVATRLRTAINSVAALATTAAAPASNGRLDLTQDATGTTGNVPLESHVADPHFLVYGMSGGADLGSPAFVELRPSRQRVRAYRLRIYEAADAPATENLSLTSITAEYGVEPGTYPVPRTQKALTE